MFRCEKMCFLRRQLGGCRWSNSRCLGVGFSGLWGRRRSVFNRKLIDRTMQRCFAFRANVCVLSFLLLHRYRTPEAEVRRVMDLRDSGVNVFGAQRKLFWGNVHIQSTYFIGSISNLRANRKSPVTRRAGSPLTLLGDCWRDFRVRKTAAGARRG